MRKGKFNPPKCLKPVQVNRKEREKVIKNVRKVFIGK